MKITKKQNGTVEITQSGKYLAFRNVFGQWTVNNTGYSDAQLEDKAIAALGALDSIEPSGELSEENTRNEFNAMSREEQDAYMGL